MSISERIKIRLATDRTMISITLHIPVDVLELMKNIARKRGFVGCEALVKAYVSECLRHDEAQFALGVQARLGDTKQSE